MTQQLFRKASKTATTGIWFARVNQDLRDFCPRAYGNGFRARREQFRGFAIQTLAVNAFGYSLQVWFEVK
jgi:hypothetical protein